MGVSIREKVKGSGVWWVFIKHDGFRKSKLVGEKRAAMDIQKQLQARLVLGDLGLQKNENALPLFNVYAQTWLDGYVKQFKRESTYRRYKEVLQKVNPALGNIPIDKIKRSDIKSMIYDLSTEGYCRGTISLIKDVVSGVMNHAIDEELITINPTQKIMKRLELSRGNGQTADPLTGPEVTSFLVTCREYQPEHYPFFLCAFRTGMRLGELLALQWADIDFHGQYIFVQRSYKLGKYTGTKTGKPRRVDMSDQLLSCLHALQLQRKADAFKAGAPVVETVFHRDGQPIEQNHIRRIFKRVLDKTGLRERRIHDMRHTFASLLLSAGVSPVYVKEQLGHSSIEMTVNIYGKWIKNDQNKGLINRLDEHPAAPYGHPEKKIACNSLESQAIKKWCRRRDSNPHGVATTRS